MPNRIEKKREAMILTTFGQQTEMIFKILEHLGAEPLINLELIACELAKQAQTCCIVTENTGVLTVIASGGSDYAIPDNTIFECVRNQKTGVVLTQHLPPGIEVALCVPIVLRRTHFVKVQEEQRASIELEVDKKGYLYIGGGVLLQNKIDLLVQMCQEVAPLVAINLEMYQLQRIAGVDKLTGVLNRKYLELRIDSILERARKTHGFFSLIMLDIDFFKPINDTYGHLAGDDVLCGISQIIQKELEKDEIVGRYGGEEFVILLPNLTGQAAHQKAEKLRKAIYAAKLLGEKRDVTVSMGIACYSEHGLTKKELIEKADRAMYLAKKNGRNQSILWDNYLNEPARVKKRITEFITDDTIQNAEHILLLFNLLALQSAYISRKEKLLFALQQTLGLTGADFGAIYLVEQTKIVEVVQSGCKNQIYNERIIQEVIQTKNEVFAVDWDNEKLDIRSGAVDWQSIAVVPIMKNGVLQGVLYVSVSIKEKEFSDSEIGLIHHVGNVLPAVL